MAQYQLDTYPNRWEIHGGSIAKDPKSSQEIKMHIRD